MKISTVTQDLQRKKLHYKLGMQQNVVNLIITINRINLIITMVVLATVRLLSFGVWARVKCGSSLKLACAWRGEPAPRARWLRGDRPVTHDPRTHLTPHGHLSIHGIYF